MKVGCQRKRQISQEPLGQEVSRSLPPLSPNANNGALRKPQHTASRACAHSTALTARDQQPLLEGSRSVLTSSLSCAKFSLMFSWRITKASLSGNLCAVASRHSPTVELTRWELVWP